MAMTRSLAEVISANQARQRRARELNRRAGAAIFPVMSREELEAWLMPRLQGARRVAEISDFTSLTLPPLDAEKEMIVLRENPDTVKLCGEEFTVEYREADWQGHLQTPRVTFSREQTSQLWQLLPDGGVQLPSGREIEVVLRYGWNHYDQFAGTDVPALKERMRAHLNREQWDHWTERPDIALPDPADPEAIIPIVEAVYGICTVTGHPLVAYGTTVSYGYRYNDSDSYFRVEWYQSRTEADKAAEQATVKLDEIRTELARKAAEEVLRQQEAEIRAAGRVLHDRLRQLNYDAFSWLCDEEQTRELAQQLRDAVWRNPPYSLVELSAWTTETEALCAKVEVAHAEAKARHEAAEQARLAAEAKDRQELAVIFAELETDATVDTARLVKSFAEEALRASSGSRDATIRKLSRELNASYGRARRQDGFRQAFPGIERGEGATAFLDLYRADDVDRWLSAAIAWLKAKASAPKPPTSSAPKPKTNPTTGGLDLSGLSGKFNVRKK